jgi:hypothetical protein
MGGRGNREKVRRYGQRAEHLPVMTPHAPPARFARRHPRRLAKVEGCRLE